MESSDVELFAKKLSEDSTLAGRFDIGKLFAYMSELYWFYAQLKLFYEPVISLMNTVFALKGDDFMKIKEIYEAVRNESMGMAREPITEASEVNEDERDSQ